MHRMVKGRMVKCKCWAKYSPSIFTYQYSTPTWL